MKMIGDEEPCQACGQQHDVEWMLQRAHTHCSAGKIKPKRFLKLRQRTCSICDEEY